MRGAATDKIKQEALRLLEIEDISTAELRLMPYIQYVIMNERRIDPQKINAEDRKILSSWREKGWITGGMSEMTMSKEFWTAMCELLWFSYVDID